MDKIKVMVNPKDLGRREDSHAIILKTPDREKVGLTINEAEILSRELAEIAIIARVPLSREIG